MLPVVRTPGRPPLGPAPARAAALFSALLLAALIAGCAEERVLEGLRPPAPTPHGRYLQSLEDADLDSTALGRAWVAASETALIQAVSLEPPATETGYLAPDRVEAVGYRIALRRGQRLVVEATRGEPDGQLFVDLFAVPDDSLVPPRHVVSADTSDRLDVEIRSDNTYLLRLQPELLAGGRYTLTVQTLAALAFPVDGRDTDAIRSFFGAPRDGGRRDHHGVDIFAPRGTPVLAVSPGRVARVYERGLGGKVVWVRDRQRGHAQYYAHLDSQLVRPGQRVEPGDTLGLVGNTGNARTTPPHLHFGIYSNGPVDPFPFLYMPDDEAAPLAADTSRLGTLMRVAGAQLPLRAEPGRRAAVVRTLPRHALVRVQGAQADWYRVALPDGAPGYVAARALETTDAPITSLRPAAAVAVHLRPDTTATPVAALAPDADVPVLGRFDDYLYVASERGAGWVAPR